MKLIDSDSYSYTDSDSYSYTDSDSYSYTESDSYSYTDSDSYSYNESDSYSYTDKAEKRDKPLSDRPNILEIKLILVKRQFSKCQKDSQDLPLQGL